MRVEFVGIEIIDKGHNEHFRHASDTEYDLRGGQYEVYPFSIRGQNY